MNHVVILGAGHAGFQCAASLRTNGYGGRISLIGNEGVLPYQRPPLSKALLLGKTTVDEITFRPRHYYDDQRIELIDGEAIAIEREARRIRLRDGRTIDYEHLVIATGSTPRTLPGALPQGVYALHTLAQSQELAALLRPEQRAVVIGAGFIGLEFAVSARAKELSVTVLDVAERPLSRVVSPTCGEAFAVAHRALGVDLRLGVGIERLESIDGRIAAVVMKDGTRLAADLVVAGIGASPRTALASEAGLAVDNGIVVDAHLLTADAAISAIGDVASFPHPRTGLRVRLESVQNATDQARAVAARLTDKPAPYIAVPWFWSEQGSHRLQIAGLRDPSDTCVVNGDPHSGNFSVLCIADDTLRAVESVNRAADHMLARRLLAKPTTVTVERAAAPGFELKQLA